MTMTGQHAGARLRAISMALALAIVLIPALAATPSAQAQTFTDLYSFTGGSDGGYPLYGSLARDSAGNLYGVTESGGSDYCGTVFEVSGTTETVLWNFTCGSDGGYPFGSVVWRGGNIYGAAYYGGSSGCGAVFKVNVSAKTETTLFSFNCGSTGSYPYGGVVFGEGGDLYGTTGEGGSGSYGTVYKLNPSTGTQTVLHNFSYSDGAYPYAALIRDGKIFYGTTYYGGSSSYGTVFKINGSGSKFTTLYNFSDGADGGFPFCALLRKGSTLYGTAESGGSSGYGVVFKLAGTTETVLYNFTYSSDGAYPTGGVVADTAGNLYGTTEVGGSGSYGTVYKLDTSNTLTAIHSFAYSDGAYPLDGMIMDSSGTLYGTTEIGGSGGAGVVFSISSPKK